METREYNGKLYQQLETYEEAESLLGKVLIGNRQNTDLKSRMLVTVVRLHENASIRVNKHPLDYIFKIYTHEDGSPVGKMVEDKFELEPLNSWDKDYIAQLINMSKVEAQIRRYIVKQGWIDTKPWERSIERYHIYYVPWSKQWFYGTINYKTFGIDIDTIEHAKWLCEQLNNANITL